MRLELLRTHVDPSHFLYAAHAKVYPWDDSLAFVTSRGSAGASPTVHANVSLNSSVSALALATDFQAAHVVDAWRTNSHALEGQDRCGDLLLVVDILNGRLLSFSARCLRCGPLSQLDLSTDMALHVRLVFKKGVSGENQGSMLPYGGCGNGERGQVFALVTSGFATQQQSARKPSVAISGALLIVEVTSPSRMREVGSVTRGVPRTPEGISVVGNYAFIGGCSDERLAIFDLSRMSEGALRLATTLVNTTYVQLVGPQSMPSPSRAVLPLALWGSPGGLATFNVSRPDQVHELGRFVDSRLAKANRVSTAANCSRYVWLPLEQSPIGSVAVVDIVRPSQPVLVLGPEALQPVPYVGERSLVSRAAIHPQQPGTSTKCYCVAVSATGRYVHAFAAPTATMYTFRTAFAADEVC